MMDVTILATTLTRLLSPFLPSLLKVGEKAAESAANKFGTEAWEQAEAVWGKLSSKVAAKPAAQEAVQDVAQTPEDPDAQAALRQQLKKLLNDDQSFAAELEHLLESASPNSTSVTISQSAGEIQQQGGNQAVQFGQVGQAGNIEIQR